MTTRTRLSIPHFLSLRSERGWTSGTSDPKATRFAIVRYHFILEDMNLIGPTLRGDTLGTYRSSAGTGIEVNDKLTWTTTTTNVEKLVHGWSRESETLAKISIECLSELGVKDVWKHAAGMKQEFQVRYADTQTSQTAVERSHTETSTREWSAKFNIAPSDTREHRVVAVYRIRPTRVYLAFVDHLTVTYEKPLWGYRRRRIKSPVASRSGEPRTNIQRFGIPIVELRRPERMPSAWVLSPEDLAQVPLITDPTQVIAAALTAHPRNHHACVWEDIPTLYQLAEVAFPIRWSKRRSSDWTEADLLAIEADDTKGKETSWWRKGRD